MTKHAMEAPRDPSAYDNFGRQVAIRLSQSADALPHDISERLRIARMQALSKHLKTAPAIQSVSSAGAATLGFGDSEESNLWQRFAAITPLILLIAGLVLVNYLNNDHLAKELAEIDSAILIDDLPPAAYADPGFAQFLKSRRDPTQ